MIGVEGCKKGREREGGGRGRGGRGEVFGFLGESLRY